MHIKMLTDDQINRIHTASLEILERIGVHVPHKEMLQMFDDAGAHVDHKAQHVHIHPEFVAHSLEQAGKKFTIYGRDMKSKAEFGHGKRNYNSTAGQALWIEKPGEKRRYATLDDVVTATRFGDALAEVLRDRQALIVASSDLTHYPAYDDAVEVDRRTLEVVATLDAARLQSSTASSLRRGLPGLSTCACGKGPLLAAMTAA